jgi:hypothetical protein
MTGMRVGRNRRTLASELALLACTVAACAHEPSRNPADDEVHDPPRYPDAATEEPGRVVFTVPSSEGIATMAFSGDSLFVAITAVDEKGYCRPGSGRWLRVSAYGATPIELAHGLPCGFDAGSVVIEAGKIYWIAGDDTRHILTIASDQPSAPTVVADARSYPESLVADSTYLYWTFGGTYPSDLDGAIFRVSKAGGVVEAIASPESAPSTLGMIGDELWWTAAGPHRAGEGSDKMELRTAAKAPGSTARTVKERPWPGYNPRVFDAASLFFFNGTNELVRMSLDGVEQSFPISVFDHTPLSLSMAGSFAYWVGGRRGGYDLLSLSLASATSRVLAGVEATPIAIGNGELYFVGRGTVRALRVP